MYTVFQIDQRGPATPRGPQGSHTFDCVYLQMSIGVLAACVGNFQQLVLLGLLGLPAAAALDDK